VAAAYGNLVGSMTRIMKSPSKPAKTRRTRLLKSGRWLLQDANARFSELVRRVRSEGPQRVTVHGRDEVVVISAEEICRLKGDLTGKALIAAMQASPHRDIEIEPQRAAMTVRGVVLRRTGCSKPMSSPSCATPGRNTKSSISWRLNPSTCSMSAP
jgi:prevent-host-death family protein